MKPILAVMIVLTLCSLPSHATAARCGVVGEEARAPIASDALAALRASTGTPGLCGPCTCDVDDSGRVSAVDALSILRAAVSADTSALRCPACPCRALPRITAGNSPRSIAVRDVDGDGHVDLITANTKSADVVVRYGEGLGRFDRLASFWVGETPLAATLVDLDHDGIDDVVTANALPGDLSILVGNGDGTFGSFGGESRFEAGLAPINAAAADLDGDSHVDLVVANSLSHDLSVLLANGDATFRTFGRIPVGRGPRWVTLVDLDGDSAMDAVTANRDDDDISILHGNGDGTFTETERIDVAQWPYHVVADDLNGDSVVDLVIANFAGRGVTLLLGAGDGRFPFPRFHETGYPPIATVTADFDGDGDVDVASANKPNVVTVFRNLGDGSLVADANYFAQGGPRAITSHDIDEDGRLDLLVAGSNSNDVIVLHGRGDGTFFSEQISEGARFGGATAVADLDGDGNQDIALAGERYWISTHVGYGDGHFVTATRVPTRLSPRQVFAAHVDRDGVLDLVLVSRPYCWDECYDPEPANSIVSFKLGTQYATLAEEEPVVTELAAEVADVADLDADGLADIVADDLEKAGLAVYLSHGADGYELDGRIDVEGPSAIRLADVVGDDAIDLLFADAANDRIGIAKGDGKGRFGGADFHAVGDGPSGIVVGDLDSDGRSDVVVQNGGSGDLSVLLASGDGDFEAETRSPGGADLRQPVLADLDGDLALDLAGMVPGTAYAMRGRGDGTFAQPTPIVANVPRFNAYGAVAGLAIGAFDADPLLDAVGVNGTMNDPTFVTVTRAGACLLP